MGHKSHIWDSEYAIIVAADKTSSLGDSNGEVISMNKLQETRVQKGLTLRDLERLSGISRAQLGRIENGQSDPTLQTMCRIAKALNMKIEDVFWCD